MCPTRSAVCSLLGLWISSYEKKKRTGGLQLLYRAIGGGAAQSGFHSPSPPAPPAPRNSPSRTPLTLESFKKQSNPTNTRSFYALSCVAPPKFSTAPSRSLRIDGERGMESCFTKKPIPFIRRGLEAGTPRGDNRFSRTGNKYINIYILTYIYMLRP